MQTIFRKLLSPNRFVPFYIVFILLTQTNISLAEHRDTAIVNPAVSNFFEYRDNHQKFKQIRAILVKHIVETEQLLLRLEQTAENKTLKSGADSQLESKLVELDAVKKELTKLQSKGLTSSIGGKIDQFSDRLQAIKNARTQETKKQAVKQLQQELKRYQTLRLRENYKIKSPLEPSGWSVKPTPKAQIVDPAETETGKQQKSQENKSPVSDNSSLRSIKTLLSSALESIGNFIIPGAVAGEYQQPDIFPGAIGCYENQADYDAHISQDMDLLQPEIEVDLGLDEAAYEKITTLAEQLNYSPVKILEYVTNKLEHEHYLGSVKGALGSLTSGGANDIDHASLLIALLRASGIPARYVRGQVYLQDKSAHLDWLNVKDLPAANKAIGQSSSTYTTSNYTIDGLSASSMEHVWVEACVPYGTYRGDGQSPESHRWVPLDPSFKRYDRTDGITQNEVFDYGSFLSERTKTLPHEEYEAQVLEHIRTIDPNLTLANVGTRWEQKTLSLEFLPDTLPYAIRTFTNWSDEITTAKSAVLPEDWQASVRIKFGSDAEFGIPMTDFAQHRITVSFEGATSSDATQYIEFMDGDRILDCDSTNLSVVPVFKKDGIAFGPSLSPLTICDGGDFRKITMGMAVRVNNKVVSVTRGGGNNIEFDTISPLDYYTITAYPFNGSDRFLEERSSRLLENLNTSSKPSDNADETIGEFLHLVLLKYMRYTTDASADIGQLFGTTGRSGHHIGLASTHADVEYIFDFPYAMHSNNFVVDVPGGLSKAVAIEGGEFDFDAMRLTGYTASHYESYVWQENAVKDAVSTVSGLQIASSKDNEVQSFTSGAELSSFVNTCTASPDTSSWARSKPLVEMVAEFRAAGFHNSYDDSLKEFFVGNNGYFTSYSTVAQIDAALAVEFIHCYPQTLVSSIANNSFPSGYTNKVTISKSPVSYRGWLGPVYATESIKDDNTSGSFGFPISSFSGGYTVPTVNPAAYSATLGAPSSSYSTGYDTPSNVSSSTPYYTTSSVSTINSGVGDGISTYSTTAFDPVNMVTGNMYHDETDISLSARGLPLLFKRTYNSRNPEDGPLGWGWTHSFNQTLKFADTTESGTADTIIWTNGTGSQKFIDLDESVTVVGGTLNITPDKVTIPNGFYFHLERPHSSGAAQEIEVKEKSGITYHFQAVNGSPDDTAWLTRITDRNGQEINLSYTDNRLTGVSDPDNRNLSFTYYDSTNLIHTITLDWDGTVHEYFYDGDGHLTIYRNPQDRANSIDTSSYAYYSDSDGHNLNHRLKSFSYANGYEMTFEYYVNGKAYRHTNAEGESATFSYNDFRREATTLDEKGRLQRYIFNENGLPLEITDTLGGKEQYSYEDPNDPMLRTGVIDAMGYETSYSYDTNGNLIGKILPSGDTITFSHHNNYGQSQLIKNALNNYSLNRYNTNGNLTDTIVFKTGFGASIDPATFDPETNSGQILSWSRMVYDANGKLTEAHRVKDFSDNTTGPWTELNYTDSVNNTEGIVPTSFSYFGDIDGDDIISTGEGLGTYASVYDPQGRLKTGFNSALYPVSYSYDAAGRLQEGTDSLGGTRAFSYDASGLITGQSLMANVNGQIILADNSSMLYDKANRRIVSADGSGAASYFEYDPAGNLKKATSPDGYTISFDYDDANRVTSAYDEEGNTVERTLDLIGRVKQLIDPNGNTTSYSYYGPEQNGRLKRITDAENRWTEFDYNSVGQITRVTNSGGHETLSEYDALGRIIRVVSPVYTDSVLGDIRPISTYQYNSLAHQSSIYGGYTNSAGESSADTISLQASYQYDDFGRLLKKYDAANNSWEISEYDIHGNVKTSSNPTGNISTATYGFGGVLKSRTITGPDGEIENGVESTYYQRNALGQPTSIGSNNVNYSYQYDTAHRLTKVTDDRNNNFVEYDYSIGGLLNSITDNHGNKSAYLYDPVGRLTGARTPDKKLISYVYDSGGRLLQKIFPNDLVTAYQYFNDNRVKSIVTSDNTSTELIRHDYTYNTSGDTDTASLALSGVTQSRSYQYDGLGRLTKETDSVNTIDLDQIEYDPFGNRRQRTVDGVTYFFNHNNLHQIVDIRTGSETGTIVASFTYDDNGNMTSKIFDGVTTTIGHDAMNRVVTVVKDGLPTEQYSYDHGIRRIAKTVGAATTNYHYSGPDILGEYSSDWTTLQALYAHGAAMDDPLVRIVAGVPNYYHSDGLGSVTGMSNTTSTLTATNRYDAWGNVTESTGTTPQYGYTGREPDATGLVYYRSRYYDPQIGRFTQPDPKGFIDGLNQYAYVMNSPVNYVDPWGMSASSPTATGDSGGYFSNTVSAVTNSMTNTGSFVGSAINNGLIQPIVTILNIPNQVADTIAGHYNWSDIDTAEERFAVAQSTPIPGDDLVLGAFGAVSSAARASKQGGRFGDLVTGGTHRHHMPAKQASPLSEANGPAIRMSPEDHRKTASYGGRKGSDQQTYRDNQAELIKQGKFDDAFLMDVKDIQSKFGNKYDNAILEAMNALP